MEARNAKGLNSTNAGDEEKSHEKKWEKLSQCKRKKIDFDKRRGPGNEGSAQSETRSADQIDDKAPPKQFYSMEKTASNEIEENDQENCLELSSNSEPQTIFEVTVRQESSLDSEEELMSEPKIPDYHVLEARVTELEEETRKLTYKLKKRIARVMRLREENSNLLDELKMFCEPNGIANLEAMKPVYSPEETRDLWSSDSTGTPK